MKKKIAKYQFGTPSCGEGTVWSEELQKCIPAKPAALNTPQYNVDYSGTPINDFQFTPSIDGRGQIQDGQILPLLTTESGDIQYDPLAGKKDSKGNFIPYQKIVPEALEQKGIYDAKSNTYAKETSDNFLEYTPEFQALNTGLDITRGIAGAINNAKNSKSEREKLLKAKYGVSKYNINQDGLNDVPVVFKQGGKTKEKQATTQDSVNVANNAKEVEAYYINKNIYKKTTGTSKVDDYDIRNKNAAKLFKINSSSYIPTKNGISYETIPFNNYRKDINDNQYYQRELQAGMLDIRAPMSLFDKRIKPQNIVGYKNIDDVPHGDIMAGDMIDIYTYDPIAVTPWKMLTPAQKLIRAKKYGTPEQKQEMGLLPKPKLVNPNIALEKSDPARLKNKLRTTSPTVDNKPQANLPNIGLPQMNTPITQPQSSDYSTIYANPNASQNTVHFNNEKDNSELKLKKVYPQKNWHYAGALGPVWDENGRPLTDDEYQQVKSKKFKTGGKNSKEIAAAALNGKEINGHELTTAQRKHFKYVLEGRIPIDGHVKDAKKKGTYAVGGQVQDHSELEKGEVFTTDYGTINKVPENHDTHEEGGSMQPNVERVLEDTSDKRKDMVSKLLRIDPNTAKEITGFKPKSAISHSKLYEKASDFHAKKQNKDLKKIESNIEYVEKQNGGQYAANSLNLNIDKMNSMVMPQDIFNSIYNHQENIKLQNGIGQTKKYAYGGPTEDEDYTLTPEQKKKAVLLTNTKGYVKDSEEDGKVYFRKPGSTEIAGYQQVGPAKGGTKTQNPQQYVENLINYDYNDLVKQKYFIDNPQNKKWYDDARAAKYKVTPEGFGYQPQEELDEVYPTVIVRPKAKIPDSTNPDYNFHNNNNENKFFEPLKWYDVAGNGLNYLSSLERTPVDLEQLKRDPLQVRELNPLPALQRNQDDFNTALGELPTNGVGFANGANLAASKYSANNQVLGQYENINKGKRDQIDQFNNESQYQLDQTNLGLRDQFTSRVLQSKEIQRQSKLNALDDLFTKIAQNRKFNKEGQLVLKTTPNFDQNANYVDNGFRLTPTSNSIIEITDPRTGIKKRIRKQ